MTPNEFLKLGHKSWLELHWTLARTEDVAMRWFNRLGLENKKFYRMCYPTNNKNSDGFFAWWMPL